MSRGFSFAVSLALVALGTLLANGTTRAQAPDPLIGTWKMDIAKSKFDPGPAGKSSTAVFAAAGAGVKATIDSVNSAGEKAQWGYTAQYDGKEVTITGTNPDVDTLVMKRTSSHVTVTEYKKAGKMTLTNTRTVSADGKTLTVTQTGTNAQGQKVNNVLVYAKG